jgi:hypothetical protein
MASPFSAWCSPCLGVGVTGVRFCGLGLGAGARLPARGTPEARPKLQKAPATLNDQVPQRGALRRS